jgi:hypothetical protein
MDEVARRAGCSASILGEYERAERTPRDEQYVRDLAGVLGVPAEALVADWSQTRTQPVSPSGGEASSPPHHDQHPARRVRAIAMPLASAIVGAVVILVLTLSSGTGVVPVQNAPEGASTVGVPNLHPSITVSPSTGLTDGQSVTVTGTGYTPSNENVWVGQCAAPPRDPAVCDHESAHQVFVQVDGNGGFTTTITAHETFQGATDANPGDPIPVDCRVASGCFISGGQANPNISALQFISFDS